MKTVIINFSGRSSDGNCAKIGEYIKESLDHEARIISVAKLNVSSCVKCEYECFKAQSSCPYYADDTVGFYDALLAAGQIIYLIPNYYDFPCANFFIINERGQCYFNAEKYKIYSNIKKRVIIIANSGFENIKNVITSCFEGVSDDDILRLSALEYNNVSISGTLIEVEAVRAAIRRFVGA